MCQNIPKEKHFAALRILNLLRASLWLATFACFNLAVRFYALHVLNSGVAIYLSLAFFFQFY